MFRGNDGAECNLGKLLWQERAVTNTPNYFIPFDNQQTVGEGNDLEKKDRRNDSMGKYSPSVLTVKNESGNILTRHLRQLGSEYITRLKTRISN